MADMADPTPPNGAYYRRRADELLDDRLDQFERDLHGLRRETRDELVGIRADLAIIKTRFQAVLIVGGIIVVVANLISPFLDNLLLGGPH